MRVIRKPCRFHHLILTILVLFSIRPVMAQESTLVQVKTFDLNLKSISNIELSFDGQNYFNMGEDGSTIIEINNALLPPKVIYFMGSDLEAESWNYSQGILEIIIREKSFITYQFSVIDTSGVTLNNVIVRLYSDLPIEGTTNNEGVVHLSIPVSLDMKKSDLFSINGYRIVHTEFSGNTGIITAELLPPIITAATTPDSEIIKPPIELNESQMDSLQSLTAFFSFLRGLDMTNLTVEQKQLIDDKFSEMMVIFSDSLNRSSLISGKISDSTLVINDIIFLTEQAILEGRLINQTREDFNAELALISAKIIDGGGNLSDGSRNELLAQLAQLNELLLANEILFTQNQNYYKSALSDLKNKLLNIKDLEEQLSDVELQRLAEQELFRKRLLINLGVILGLLLLIIVFIYLMRKISKQKKELGIAHEEVKNINDNLELLVAKRTKSLQKVNNELDTFLYKSSHDLKRPLTTILGLANVAKITLNKEAIELFDKTKQTAIGMNRLLLKLLTLSQINNPEKYSEIKFKDITNKIHSEFKEKIDEIGTKVTFNIADDIKFNSYPALIESIIRNLFDNALLYSSFKNNGQPQVEVSIYCKDGSLNLKVTDNGDGISSDIEKKVWNMFYRGNANSTGNGLGLYITKRAVEVLKGRISFETKSGNYTTFFVQIPLDNPEISSSKAKSRRLEILAE